MQGKLNEKIIFIEKKYEEIREDLFEFKSKISSLEGVINTLIERYEISKNIGFMLRFGALSCGL